MFFKKCLIFFISFGLYASSVVTLSPAQEGRKIWGISRAPSGASPLGYNMVNLMTREKVEAIFIKYLRTDTDMSQKKRIQLAKELSKKLMVLAGKHRFSPAFILSIIQAESTFHMDARSKVGAIGLMQLMPATAGYISKKWKIRRYQGAASLYDPVLNMEMGVTYLAYLRDRYNDDARTFLTAYNAGPTLVDRFLKAERELDQIRESRKYIESISAKVAGFCGDLSPSMVGPMESC